MEVVQNVTPSELFEFLLQVAPVRPIFVWGPPGIGKSSLVQKFASDLGMECVSLLGGQLAPEDIIGVPKIVDNRSVFCPPKMIARKEPYVLFLDELNACSQEVQKAFYSLILEKRIGEYYLPEGSIVIGAGNRSTDSAIVRQMSSALINRLMHIGLKVSAKEWLEWAKEECLHSLVIDFVSLRGDYLWSRPPKDEEPFSTPRSWHMLSDALYCFGDSITQEQVTQLAYSCLSPTHAQNFVGFFKNAKNKFILEYIIKGTKKWPARPEDRDVLYFLVMSFREKLQKEIAPSAPPKISANQFPVRAKKMIADLLSINKEMAMMAIAENEKGEVLPAWFLNDIIKEFPLIVRK